jgi:tetratricopeptide (TPR) repeat protein
LNNGCPQVPEPALVSAGGLIANTRGGTDPLIPYIISPRSTKLLDPMPTLRWNAAPGAQTYTVRISGIDWQEQVEATEVEYPGDPALQPGTDYLLIVEADSGKSSKDEGLPGLGFSLLAQEEAARLRADMARVDALNLSADARAFALAQLYAGHQLYAEAIELLEQSAANDQAANVSRALGELYQQVGLLIQAESSYSRAVELAEGVGDLESATSARARLGEVYLALGNKNESRIWFTQAQAGYESLGDSQHAGEIAARLAELNQ